MIEELEKES